MPDLPDSPLLPERAALRPGLGVARRDDRHLQVGLDPPHCVVLPDSPEVRRLLEELRLGVRPRLTTAQAHRALAALRERDLLVDAARLEADLARAGGRAADRATVLAAYAAHGADAPRRLDARAAVRVEVDAPPGLEDLAARLLRECRLGVSVGDASALLVVRDGVVSRDRVDEAVRAGLPHLLVQAGPTGVTVGPFVVPGVTACVRCVDAHRAEADPRRSLLIEQAGRVPATGQEPRDPALMTIAVARAVRDLVAFADGDEPASWSSTLTVTTGPDPVRRGFTRHPYCGCSWGDALAG